MEKLKSLKTNENTKQYINIRKLRKLLIVCMLSNRKEGIQ